MKFHFYCAILAILAWFIPEAPAAIYYVNQNSINPAPPYNSWSSAAVSIQDALNVATNGDEILVTNGLYAAGGLAMAGTLTNRVALTAPVTVQSVNGPWVTIIQGAGAVNGPAAVRCAWLTNGAALVGFTLTAGATATTGSTVTETGGGVWCASSNAVVSNCVIAGNTSDSYGGGVYQGTLRNCLVTSNSSAFASAGAVANASLCNCTVVSNFDSGLYNGTGTNCIVYYNSPSDSQNFTTLYFSCIKFLPPSGSANITVAPQLFADGLHLLVGSPCIGAGTNVVGGTDIFGQPWANPPSIGCVEFQSRPLVTKPRLQLTGYPIGFTAGSAAVAGQPPFGYSWLKDGAPLSDNGHFKFTQSSNLTAIGVSASDAGNYQLVVSNVSGVATSSVVPLIVHCVAASGTNPVTPYTSWGTAATNIQDAITAASANDIVLATNGVYAYGGVSMDATITNCVSVSKAILVDSVNGPDVTVIQGAWDPVSTNGAGAVRCVWMTNNTILRGFTLQGGATRSGTGTAATEGGGIYSSTNAWIYNCRIATNYASYQGGGIFAYSVGTIGTRATLINCTLKGNHAVGSGTPGSGTIGAGSGGGAYGCNLQNCLVTANFAHQLNGGGTENCNATNCAYTQNLGYENGMAAYAGTLVNCTVAENQDHSSATWPAVYGATLVNCIVFTNSSTTTSNANYGNCTMTYCCADPLPSGAGNVDVNPLLLADGFHLAAGSPCIGAGTANVVSGTDIDGQPWNTPPSIGCDEWLAVTEVVVQPTFQINEPVGGLTASVTVAGQPPFTCFWSLNGTLIQDNGHFSNSGTVNLAVNNFGPGDAGLYQVVVSNAFGVVTSQVAQVVMHVVNAANVNPVAPYLTWATAATNIQDAINAASTGDVVLVTNGIYTYGGLAVAGSLTNRVALNKALTVTSVNGYAVTAIQGAWDPVSTNGPGAVRCAYVANGAVLSGFTLQNGATQATGDSGAGEPLESGGGAFCSSDNGLVAGCMLSNNCAIYGGGISSGTLNNSCVTANLAVSYGGGACFTRLNNCTLIYNSADLQSSFGMSGAGINTCYARNCIILNNYDNFLGVLSSDNCSIYDFIQNCCTTPAAPGNGNIDTNPQLLDLFHVAGTSPCRGAGSALYASGTDLDGEVWNNPPAIGCDEVIPANLTGPLTATIYPFQTSVLVNRVAGYSGFYNGRASSLAWSFGDGQSLTNPGPGVSHTWTSAGNYTVTFTVYNNDHPGGVSASAAITVVPLAMPQLQSIAVVSGQFQFQFLAQTNANYTVQYTTSLAPPVVWNTLQNINFSSGGMAQIMDATAPKGARFYRVLAQ